jgi:tetratricopeptide (TPR) repeat protein
MSNGSVFPIEILLKEKKNRIKGQVMRAVLFSRFKIIELRTSLNDSYYLIYYKNSLIYGELLENVQVGSFIDKACHEGIVIQSEHPFLQVLIPDESIVIPNKNKIFSHLQNQYSLQEVAQIATALDSFFTKDQLSRIIDKIFFHYRRNGNFYKAFQIIHIIKDFSPELSLAGDSMNSQDFHSYDSFYKSSPLPLIYKKDPLFVELHCFKNRMSSDESKTLEDLLRNQGCFLELLLLWMEKVEKIHKADSIEKYSSLGLQFVTMEHWISTLCYLKINPFRELSSTKTVMEKLVYEGHYERAASYLLNFIDDLPVLYHDILKEVWANLDTEFIVSHLDAFIIGIQQLVQKKGTTQSEQKLLHLVGKLLEIYDLKTVYEKLQPIQQLFPHSLVIQKVQRMTKLIEDPDHMMELGQYYAEFKQYDEAIECFSWEMELHPAEPLPVRQLSKMYQSKGMVEEASAYQQVYNQLVRNQEIG